MGRKVSAAPPPDEFAAMRAGSAVLEVAAEMRRVMLTVTDPKQQREALRRKINVAVGLHADHDWWVAGKTAELVIAGRLELKKVLNLMATVSRRRALPADEPYWIEKPEPWLQRAVAKLCNAHHVPFAKSRVVQEAANATGGGG